MCHSVAIKLSNSRSVCTKTNERICILHYSFKGWLFYYIILFWIRNVCLCVRNPSSQSLSVCLCPMQTDPLSCLSVSALWWRGQDWSWSCTSLKEEGRRRAGGIERWSRSVVVAWDNDSVTGHGEEAHPRATAPPNIKHAILCWSMEMAGQHFQLSQARSIKGFISSQD